MKFNAYLRDMNLGVRGTDERRIEVLAQDLLCFNGAQLAIDITLRSAVCASGEAQPSAAEEDGAVLVQARREKEVTPGGTYLLGMERERFIPELVSSLCRKTFSQAKN